jgi:hypothetical protein
LSPPDRADHTGSADVLAAPDENALENVAHRFRYTGAARCKDHDKLKGTSRFKVQGKEKEGILQGSRFRVRKRRGYFKVQGSRDRFYLSLV